MSFWDNVNRFVERVVDTQQHTYVGRNDVRPVNYRDIGTGPRLATPEVSTEGFIKYLGAFGINTAFADVKLPVAFTFPSLVNTNFRFDRTFNFFMCQPVEDGTSWPGVATGIVWRAKLNGSPVTDWMLLTHGHCHIQTSAAFNTAIQAPGSDRGGGADNVRAGSTANYAFSARLVFDELDVFNFSTTLLKAFPWIIREPFYPMPMSINSP